MLALDANNETWTLLIHYQKSINEYMMDISCKGNIFLVDLNVLYIGMDNITPHGN